MREAVIVAAAGPDRQVPRIAEGFTAPQLGAIASARRPPRRIDPATVDECIMGNVVAAGEGQNRRARRRSTAACTGASPR